MSLKPNCGLLFFTGFFIFLLNGTMPARIAFASHHKALIAFASTRDGNAEIYVMDSNGENQTRLTHDGGNKLKPSWSPDGQSMAFTLNDFFVRPIQIYVMESDGENRRKLTNGRHDWSPAWSPDSEMIAYESWRGEDFLSEIHLMTADGKYLKQLSDLHERGDYDPDWFDPVTLAVASVGNTITI